MSVATTKTSLRASAFLAAAALLLLTGCVSSDSDESQSETTAVPTTTTATSNDSVTTSTEGSTTSSSVEDEIEPARRVPSQVSDEDNHWLGRLQMTDNAITVTWSVVEGDDVVYQLFRFPTAELPDYDVDLGTPIHEAPDTATAWTDDSVETGTFYTYFLRVLTADEQLERRWTQALAVTDTTPPADITGLTGEVTDEGVLLSWDQSSDNVEFGSYGVFRVALSDEDDDLYLGGGGDLGVVSFIDDDIPSSGEVTYAVLAYDFHGNQSRATEITIRIG